MHRKYKLPCKRWAEGHSPGPLWNKRGGNPVYLILEYREYNLNFNGNLSLGLQSCWHWSFSSALSAKCKLLFLWVLLITILSIFYCHGSLLTVSAAWLEGRAGGHWRPVWHWEFSWDSSSVLGSPSSSPTWLRSVDTPDSTSDTEM